MFRVGVFVGGALLALAGVASAYDQRVHEYISARAYDGPKTVTADVNGAAVVRALRERIWRAGAEHHDAEVRKRFLERYPDLAHFDAWELKRFLSLNPDKQVAGLDENVALPAGSDAAQVYALASRLPDDDRRNQDRFRHDAERHVVNGPFGEPLPDDPATLEMGGLTGLASQAHAHYGLPKVQFSDDPEVLKKEPRRFAVPPTVHTFGADFAELYTELAVLASHLPGGDRLALVFAGAAAHHIEDVANQIHTVQVGLYDFFVDAKLESIKEELRTAGGLLRERPSFISIGVGIITNYHTLSEALYAKHVLTPGDPVAKLTDHEQADPAFVRDLMRVRAGCVPGFGRTLTQLLIERSSVEGAPVYAAIREAADRRLSRVGQRFNEADDPDREIRSGADLSKLYELNARGVRRGEEALAAWWGRYATCVESPGVDDAVGDLLIRDRLAALDATEARQRAFVPKLPEKQKINFWYLFGDILALVALAWLGRRLLRRRPTRGK